MHPYLDRLGIREEAQAFFEPSHQNLQFSNPSDSELWTAGEPTLATEIFICGSAMDAICYLHLNYHLFNRPEQLLFMSFKGTPSNKKPKSLYGARYHLLFANDLLGHVGDLKFACWLCNYRIWIEYFAGGKLKINFRCREYLIDEKIFTLNYFERKSKYRFGVSTHKPKIHNTFFEQLKYGHHT
ncbi:MAG: hypothetical protein ACHQHN_04465 [Sphingobacteriales bacterium]